MKKVELGTFLLVLSFVVLAILIVTAGHLAVYRYNWVGAVHHWPTWYGGGRLAGVAAFLLIVGAILFLVGVLFGDALGIDDDLWKYVGVVVFLSAIGVWLAVAIIANPYLTFARARILLLAGLFLVLVLLVFGLVLPDFEKDETVSVGDLPEPMPTIVEVPQPTTIIIQATAPPPVIIQPSPVIVEVPVPVQAPAPIIVVEQQPAAPPPVIVPIPDPAPVAPVIVPIADQPRVVEDPQDQPDSDGGYAGWE